MNVASSTICLDNLTRDQEARIKSMLQWPNPDYSKKVLMGKSTWNTPKDIVLWQKAGHLLIVPFGMLQTLWSMGVDIMPVSHLKANERRFNGKVDNLYGYQSRALERALKAKNGVLVAPCGSGKTQIGIAIIAELGLRALWLTHTHELLKQSMSRAKQYLDIPMGTITEGKINASDGITFATVQTLSKIDLSQFKNFWDVIIVDECHRCVGTPTRITMFWKVLSQLSARYKIGLTATPKRGDGMEKAMYALLGPKFHEISRDDVKGSTVPLYVDKPLRTYWTPNLDKVLNSDGTLNYTSLITDCIESYDRNKVVAGAINWAGCEGATLVLSERIEHLKRLSEMCVHEYGILSTCKKSERKNLLQDIEDGKIKVLFATYAIAKEGLDIPCLKHLVMASPIKDQIAVTQSAGRVMRAYPEKEYGTLWDFEDDMPMLKRWLQKRMAIYKKLKE